MAQVETDLPIHHLRGVRVVAFQITSIACQGASILATIVLHKTTTAQTAVSGRGAELSSSSLSVAGGLMIAAGALAGTACALFLIPITLPSKVIKRYKVVRRLHALATNETKRSVLLKEALLVTCAAVLLGALLPSTIIVANQLATITGVSSERAAEIASELGLALRYRDSGLLVACIICGWVGFLSTLLCLLFVSLASRKVLQHSNRTAIYHQSSTTPLGNGAVDSVDVSFPVQEFAHKGETIEHREEI